VHSTNDVTTQSKLPSSTGNVSPTPARSSIGTAAAARRAVARFWLPSLGSIASTRSTTGG
jgi:hypothetical protein